MQSKVKPDTRLMVGFGSSLMAAASYGATSVIARHVVTSIASPLVLSAFALLFGSLIMLAVFHRDIPQGLRAPRGSVLPLVIAGSFGAAGPTLLYFALSQAPVTVVAPIASINPLVALVLSHLLLKRSERITLRLIAGTLMVIGGVVLVILGRG